MKVPRVKSITEEKFIEEHIVSNKPVIVTDAMENWDLEKFKPEYIKKEFGHHKVQVYNDLFDLQTIQPLEKYIDANFFRSEKEGLSKQYMRWYTKLKEVDFYWSDKAFDSLKNFWSQPYFVPSTSLAVPSTKGSDSKSITEYNYPYKGLFISGKGSRTRLHKDPFMSNAVLCQFYGQKHFYLYGPDKQKNVMNNGDFVDVKNPDLNKFPSFSDITHDYEDVLSPGEIILFPSGWFHDVTCVSDSISITWNFVHAKQLETLCNHIKNNPEDDQLEILKYFIKGEVSDTASAEEIISYFRKKFAASEMTA
ncbi:cupin-like domain-containing protein [Aquimarina longa]|uniref:cupin-like domain-containing protein n=1 Tax=Aquimarina longa TaxID=1080221 RepID=UPI000783E7FA|nr:cupin-like domain-containing protein [Aquimarina longa]